MTFKFDNVYVNDTYTIAGPYEKKGPLGKEFDKTFTNLYYNEKTWEKAEIKIVSDTINNLLKKVSLEKENIDLIVGGDLQNQIAASCYGVYPFNRPFLGIYSACATSIEGIIISSLLIDSKKIDKAIAVTSSHNMVSEKQFRNPTEYGAPKPPTATFTATGGASILLSNIQSSVKIESATIGIMTDLNQNDPLNMGANMAPAAALTIYNHLKELKRDSSYYDLILTGDLGFYGKKILEQYMDDEYKIILKNYNDCGVMLYELKKQKECLAGGSGPVCSALVNYSYIYRLLKEKKLKRVLLVATGALFSPTSSFQHQNILGIAHCVGLEAQ